MLKLFCKFPSITRLFLSRPSFRFVSKSYGNLLTVVFIPGYQRFTWIPKIRNSIEVPEKNREKGSHRLYIQSGKQLSAAEDKEKNTRPNRKTGRYPGATRCWHCTKLANNNRIQAGGDWHVLHSRKGKMGEMEEEGWSGGRVCCCRIRHSLPLHNSAGMCDRAVGTE